METNKQYVIQIEYADKTKEQYTYLHKDFWLKHLKFWDKESKSKEPIAKLIQAYEMKK